MSTIPFCRRRGILMGGITTCRAVKEIGALAAVLSAIDGLVFTAGIGENSTEIRRRICESCVWLGIELDTEANVRKGPKTSASASRVSA